MAFKNVISQVEAALQSGNVDQARAALDQAWELATSKQDRKMAHDMGNKVQAAIFEGYLAQ